MRANRFALAALVAATLAVPAFADLKPGSIELKSPGVMTFGPKNVLFIGDLGTATIYAVDTRDEASGDRNAPLNVERIDTKIAELVGAGAGELKIKDMKVNPGTGNVFLSVAREKVGGGLIVKVDRGGKVSELVLKDVPCAQVALSDAPTDQRRRNMSITALAFANNRLFVAGLTNEEFSSAFRSIEYPFKDADKGTGVEIYHGSHGRWETASPIRTFTPFDINGQAHLLAAYTCTPLVKLPVGDLKAGEKVKGVTVAELGNRNTPLDMVVYKKDGKTFILIANTSRGVMKLNPEGIESTEAITAHVADKAGLKYETINDLKNVTQLDKLSDTQALVLVETKDAQSLKTVDLP
jgi:hypothetical protein